MKILFKLKEILLYVFFPKTCFACQKDLPFGDKGWLCAECFSKIGPLEAACKRCGAPLKNGGAHCYECKGADAKKFACSIIRSALAFSEPVRKLIHGYKYTNHKYLADYFAGFMKDAFNKEKEFKGVNLITAIPLHKKRFRARGYNQSALLAETLAKNIGVEYSLSILIRTKNTKTQTKLSKRERAQNMVGAFDCPSGGAKGKTILLVDDVCTTGATLEAAARALKACGAKKVFALVLARE